MHCFVKCLFFNLRAKREGSLFERRFMGWEAQTRSPRFAVFLNELGPNIGIFGWNLGKMLIFWTRTAWRGLFLDSAIYRGSLFSGRNTKTGPGAARSHAGDNVIEEKLFNFINPFRKKIYKKYKKSLVIFQKFPIINPQYLINGKSDQKSDTNKKDVKGNFLSEVFYQI